MVNKSLCEPGLYLLGEVLVGRLRGGHDDAQVVAEGLPCVLPDVPGLCPSEVSSGGLYCGQSSPPELLSCTSPGLPGPRYRPAVPPRSTCWSPGPRGAGGPPASLAQTASVKEGGLV